MAFNIFSVIGLIAWLELKHWNCCSKDKNPLSYMESQSSVCHCDVSYAVIHSSHLSFQTSHLRVVWEML